MSANQLYLLVDHVKLSLLERQRAQSLNLPNIAQQDAQIKHSLEQFQVGLRAIETEHLRLIDTGDSESARASSMSLQSLQKQYDDLISQFHGFKSPSPQDAPTNDNHILPEDSTTGNASPSQSKPQSSLRPSSSTPTTRRIGTQDAPSGLKSVRFSENPSFTDSNEPALYDRYTDNDEGGFYPENTENGSMSNVQVHAYHDQIMRQQDEQLDALGVSIGRQRDLGIRIGDELEEHVQMLDHMDTSVERHSSRVHKARTGIGKIVKGVGESKQMMIIITLIIVLILLIVITK